uniref:Uncharacterized protein n=1 Tax=Physcomitrium patens TaxID=3218 RepID=A0A2K1IRG0_PHYPA|nr:hypothetical protein PHYPA_025982 [Physcomitrium patens]
MFGGFNSATKTKCVLKRFNDPVA